MFKIKSNLPKEEQPVLDEELSEDNSIFFISCGIAILLVIVTYVLYRIKKRRKEKAHK